MALKIKVFSAFGVTYRTTQYPAVLGFEILDRPSELTPLEILCRTEVLCGNDWVLLSDEATMNALVIDAANAISPLMVLRAIMTLANEINFEFLNSWTGVKIPNRFIDGGKSVSTKYAKPIIAQLVAAQVATLRELEEYYSLEDAFKMFDILTAKGVNEALSNEAASKKK